jgi:hypothetical protein
MRAGVRNVRASVILILAIGGIGYHGGIEERTRNAEREKNAWRVAS